MSTRMVSLVPDEYYHIYNRGNSKQRIFLNTHDYERFVKLLFLSNSVHSFKIRNFGTQNIFEVDRDTQLVNILAYCLMPNHFHILLTPLEEGGVSKFMLRLTTAYSMYFNKKNNRSGALFEGVFKSEFVHDDTYLKYLFSYIHLNPVKLIDAKWREHGIKNKTNSLEYLFSYKYSSLLDYLAQTQLPRDEGRVLDKDIFLDHFPTEKIAFNELNEWLSYQT